MLSESNHMTPNSFIIESFIVFQLCHVADLFKSRHNYLLKQSYAT
jgi:hypothetical protein